MSGSSALFNDRLEKKVIQQLSSQRVGYLLGAGASHLNGNGFPLASQLWGHVSLRIQEPERNEIQRKLDEGPEGIEIALDLLDNGSVFEKPHRYLVIEAIAEHFLTITAPIECHRNFVSRLAQRDELNIPIFCLNYDSLIESSGDAECVRVVDGFLGLDKPFFEPQTFQELFAISHRGPRKPQADWRKGTLHLYKLHGSMGWFHLGGSEIRRLGFGVRTPEGAKRLMVPPQHRKTTDTTAQPYSALWSDFRGLLCHGPLLINRLVTIGYGFLDEHVNAVIANALARSNFTLLIFARTLRPEIFQRWGGKKNVVIVTKTQCSLNGEIGPGHSDLWSFERLCLEV